ncbi:hypothetical protein [Candidatus Palauibacter sp.]|uniref:hypothetical protein n=1 Tax=Candidatus Palauibacter sp. TaxID=3101350 RepID=UPI003C6EDFAA
MKRSIVLVAGLALGACSDVEGPDTEGAPRFSQQQFEHRIRPAKASTDQPETPTQDMAARTWFGIAIDVAGSLKPDQQIDLTVTYTANYATTDADLRVTLPEVEYAKWSDWGSDYTVSVGREVPAKLEASQGFTVGGEVTQTTSFSVPSSGIYRVFASARSGKARPDGTMDRVRAGTHKTVWILVDEGGGRVLDGFDPELVPDGFHPQPGPFRKVDTGQPKPDHAGEGILAQSRGFSKASSCGSDEVCITFVYYDEDLNETRSLPGVRYEYEIVDAPSGFEDSGSGFADSQGTISVSCPVYGARGEGTATFSDSKARIVPRSDNSFEFGYGDCGEEVEYQLPSIEGRVWVTSWHSIRDSELLFPARSVITFRVNPPNESGCVFQTGDDAIRLIENDDWVCIWGGYGIFVVAHEYGHAMHHELLGGIASYDSSLCEDHEPDVLTDLGCAYNEGWANYYGMVTQATIYAGSIAPEPRLTEQLIESNHYYDADEDGSIDEGTVAAFFFDVLDSANEDHDDIDLSGQDLYEVMGTCRVREGNVMVRPGGIDHLIWCLEAEVDGVITGGDDYFSTRDPHPTQENQSDHDWDETDIRTLWLTNLYGGGN